MLAASSRLKLISFDAAGTLFYLPKRVGFHYALIGRRVGWHLNAEALDRAFLSAWKGMPPRLTTGLPRVDDDKRWWRELVDRVIAETNPETQKRDRDTFFEIAYGHFAEAGVWELYPEVIEVLQQLRPRYRLCVISNFDGRLRMILEQFGISRFFAAAVISSEVGADKPDSLIFRRAAEMMNVATDEMLHVGDDPVRDWEGARAAGLSSFELDRPRNSLRDLLSLAPFREVD